MTTPIYFIHGHSGSARTANFLRTYVEGLRSFDLPGFGKASKPNIRYTKEVFVKALKKEITQKSVLIGYSMGAVIAKDFALAYPHLVSRLILITYPMQKDKEALIQAYRRKWLYRQYVDKNLISWLLCKGHNVYKMPLLLGCLFIRPHQLIYANDWFKHTHWSATSSIHDTLLTDDWRDLRKLKMPVTLISGDHDVLVDTSLMKEFDHHIIPGMRHWFFDQAEEVAGIIENEIKRS